MDNLFQKKFQKEEEHGCLYYILFFIFAIFLVILYVFALSYCVQLFWNNSISEIFDVKQITFTQACCLFALGNILFNGSKYDYHKKSN